MQRVLVEASPRIIEWVSIHLTNKRAMALWTCVVLSKKFMDTGINKQNKCLVQTRVRILECISDILVH